ncbi:PAS domain S-box-containing protein [Streptomyces sp. DvalAA-14]|uniref:PAS domain-containing protein n=1 Tax=unclassified Streptomyces TaxID=2593676 RepID=UPI00081B62AE|nr:MULTISPECIES: PAS domain-containing protein [unclassified Streptomyces]MYS24907.1 PAS domain-containing protein [Streptomyces sp. SID4948]SCE50453.1 PAS domain S-box-containing protein [Streptomyces sp. DvalAA-14]
MLEPTPLGAAVALIDRHGKVLAWTDAAQALLGYSSEEVVGRSAENLLTRHRTVAELSEGAARARVGGSWSGSAELRRKDGQAVRVAIRATPLSGDGGADWFVAATESVAAVPAWSPQPTVAAALLERIPIGLSICDGDTRCVWRNQATVEWDTSMGRDRLGLTMREVYPGYPGREIEAVVRGVFETGEPVIEREYRWTPPGEDEERVFSSTYFRLEGAEGRPLGVCAMATDISTSQGRRHFLRINEASRRIGTALEVGQTAQELADVAVPLLADFVIVDLAESAMMGEEEPLERLKSSDAWIPVFRRAGMASVHEGTPEAIWQVGEVVYVPPSSPFARALSPGRPITSRRSTVRRAVGCIRTRTGPAAPRRTGSTR